VDYKALRRILQTRPFDPLSKLPCRYFIDGGSIRIEQGREGRAFQFEMPDSLARNLLWFAWLRDFADAAHLRVTPVATQEGNHRCTQ